jgi:hypothetical protein
MHKELASGIQGTLCWDKHLFQEHGVVNTLLWPIEKRIKWLGTTVAKARKVYILKITQG